MSSSHHDVLTLTDTVCDFVFHLDTYLRLGYETLSGAEQRD